MYQLWFGKQGSGYCRTEEVLGRWDKTANSKYPNCGVHNKNDAPLNRFPNRDRRLMLIECIEDIKEWMVDNHTYPELVE